jgi:hypothetical protein
LRFLPFRRVGPVQAHAVSDHLRLPKSCHVNSTPIPTSQCESDLSSSDPTHRFRSSRAASDESNPIGSTPSDYSIQTGSGHSDKSRRFSSSQVLSTTRDNSYQVMTFRFRLLNPSQVNSLPTTLGTAFLYGSDKPRRDCSSQARSDPSYPVDSYPVRLLKSGRFRRDHFRPITSFRICSPPTSHRDSSQVSPTPFRRGRSWRFTFTTLPTPHSRTMPHNPDEPMRVRPSQCASLRVRQPDSGPSYTLHVRRVESMRALFSSLPTSRGDPVPADPRSDDSSRCCADRLLFRRIESFRIRSVHPPTNRVRSDLCNSGPLRRSKSSHFEAGPTSQAKS